MNAHGQEVAYAWFNEHWMAKSDNGGRWMLCHFGHGGPLNNVTEGNNGGYKSFVLGAASAESFVNPRELLANTCKYISSKCAEQRHKLQRSQGSSAYLRRTPSIEPFEANKVKKLHPFALCLIPLIAINSINRCLFEIMEPCTSL